MGVVRLYVQIRVHTSDNGALPPRRNRQHAANVLRVRKGEAAAMRVCVAGAIVSTRWHRIVGLPCLILADQRRTQANNVVA